MPLDLEKAVNYYEKYCQIMNDRKELNRILAGGANKARERAQVMIDNIHRCLGFIPGPIPGE